MGKLAMRSVGVFLALLLGVPSHAADNRGRFAAWDFGLVRCYTLQQAQQEERGRGELDSMHWFAGFITGVNIAAAGTQSITGPETLNFGDVYVPWKEWLEHFCRVHPAAQVGDAAQVWVQERLSMERRGTH